MGFRRVAVSVAQVQNLPEPLFFAEVPGHQGRLGLEGAPGRLGQKFPVPGQEFRGLLVHQVGQAPVEQEPGLVGLGQALGQLGPGQAVKGGQVHQDAFGQVEMADLVFGAAEIKGRLPAHGRVHRAQEGGGDQDELKAAPVEAGAEGSQVAQAAAAPHHQPVVPGQAGFGQPGQEPVGLAPVLGRLAPTGGEGQAEAGQGGPPVFGFGPEGLVQQYEPPPAPGQALKTPGQAAGHGFNEAAAAFGPKDRPRCTAHHQADSRARSAIKPG